MLFNGTMTKVANGRRFRHDLQCAAGVAFAVTALGCGIAGIEGGPEGDPGQSVALDRRLSPLKKAYIGAGGKKAIDKLKTLRIASTGARWVIGETYRSDDDPGKVGTFTLDTSLDV